MIGENEVRINFNLGREEANQLDSLLPWGTRTALLRSITEMVLRFMIQYPYAVGLLLNGHIELKMKDEAIEQMKKTVTPEAPNDKAG